MDARAGNVRDRVMSRGIRPEKRIERHRSGIERVTAVIVTSQFVVIATLAVYQRHQVGISASLILIVGHGAISVG